MCLEYNPYYMKQDHLQTMKQTEMAPSRRPKSVLASRKASRKRIWTIDIRKTHYKVIRDVAEKKMDWVALKEQSPQAPNVIWTDYYVTEDELNSMQPYQKINHFPSSFQLGNKSFLSRNITKMRKMFPQEYSFFPESWTLPEDIEAFKREAETRKGATWILKPANLSQGRGIVITSNLDNLEDKVKKGKKQYVVQKYIDNPYLLSGLKFDLRLYVLVFSLKPLQIFIFKDGLARFATNSYKKPSRSNMKDTFMHLTNYAINKKSPVFSGEEETGHKRKFSSVIQALRSEGKNVDELMGKICKGVTSTIVSVQPLLSHLYATSAPSKFALGKNCFEIFGFDFLVDQNLSPFLLEVNHTPSFRISSEVDSQIKTNLIKETFVLLQNKNLKTETYSQPFVWDHSSPLSYLRIYPTLNSPDPYRHTIEHSRLLFDIWTGVVKKPNRSESVNYNKSSLESKCLDTNFRLPTAPEMNTHRISKREQRSKTITATEKVEQVKRSVRGEGCKNKATDKIREEHFKTDTAEILKVVHSYQRPACYMYNFIERNIDGDYEGHLGGKAPATNEAKRVLMKSFNSKFYRSATRTKKRQQNFHNRSTEIT